MSADGTAVSEASSPCQAQVLEFDFETRRERTLRFDEALAAMHAGKFVWIDLEVRDEAEARQKLAILPELHWPHGYWFFWSMVGGIVITLLSLMRRSKLI